MKPDLLARMLMIHGIFHLLNDPKNLYNNDFRNLASALRDIKTIVDGATEHVSDQVKSDAIEIVKRNLGS